MTEWFARSTLDVPFEPRVSWLRPLRIALVTEYYYPHVGGICEHVHFFAQEARARGHHVDIITSHLNGARDQPAIIRLGRSIPLYANGSHARLTVGWGLRGEVRETLRRGEYDVLHMHSPLAPSLPMLAIQEARSAVKVGTFHTDFDGSAAYRFYPSYFQRHLDRLDAAVAVSPTAVRAYARYFDARWRIVPNGVDLGLFTPSAPAPEVMRDGAPTVLFVGRFDPRNGLASLILAFRKIQRVVRDVRLIVVGDGPLRTYYRACAAGDPNIVFVGALGEERAQYYAHATVYACPATKASFGITLLEAMAAGAPVVCSNIPGFSDVVEHDREALMTTEGDTDALAAALVTVLESASLRQRLASSGRERAALFSWHRITDHVLSLYAGLLQGGSVLVA